MAKEQVKMKIKIAWIEFVETCTTISTLRLYLILLTPKLATRVVKSIQGPTQEIRFEINSNQKKC